MGTLIPLVVRKLRDCFAKIRQIEKGVVSKAAASARFFGDFRFGGPTAFKQNVPVRVGEAKRTHESRGARNGANFSEFKQEMFAISLIARRARAIYSRVAR